MKYTYKNSGVNIDLANDTTKELKAVLKNKIDGEFATITEHQCLKDFYFCATTDGIGSKVLPLLAKQDYATIANDLIAMNLNDLACVGAFPVSFLDYIAVNSLDKNICLNIIKELQKQLKNYNCQLAGGEIAELKNIIKENSLDISGYASGLVRKENLLGKHKVKKGDIIIGLESSGIHANGFTLINQMAQDGILNIDEALTPTKIYINEILELSEKNLIKAVANITGGGISDNLSRIIPDGLCAVVDKNSLPTMEIFEKIKQNILEKEAFKVFNMGCGMAIIADESNFDSIKKIARIHNPWKMGVITDDKTSSVCIS